MNKKLVCYFSASGITKKVAEKIAALEESDLFEIEPVEKYTDEDLNWMDKTSRSSVEMHNRSIKPKAKNKVTNIDDYNTIILGFPVWWDLAPTIVNTFIEENDLTNKDIYVFVTSGSSSYNGSLNDLKETYPNLNFMDGIRLTLSSDDETILSWLNK